MKVTGTVKRVVFARLLCAACEVSGGEHGDLRIMTQNMDEGTQYLELIAATNPQEFVAAVTVTYQNILATRPAERAAAMARTIARQHPDLVGVQERRCCAPVRRPRQQRSSRICCNLCSMP